MLIVNDHVRLDSIPPEAHDYVVNGRSPLGWFIDRYKVKQDRDSGVARPPIRALGRPERGRAIPRRADRRDAP